MKKASLVLVAVGLGLVLMAGGVFAATDSPTLTINAAVSARAKLTLSPTAIHFPDGDPDASGPNGLGTVAATEGAVSATASVRTSSGGQPTLTVKAPDFSTTIPSSRITWTASGSPFSAGTMATTDVSAASFATGSGSYTGSFAYYFQHKWTDLTGSYSTTATFTLTAP